MNRAEYLKFQRPYKRVLWQTLLDLDFFVEDLAGVNIHSITHRLKSFDSALKKAQNLSIPIPEIQDIAGIRIVVVTADEVDVIIRFFSRKQVSKDLVIKSDDVIKRKNGYRARHLILEFNGHYSRSVYETHIEVQVLTLLQHTFNYISRSWIYKTERSLSDEWHVEFKNLAKDLAKVDEQIAKLQKNIIIASASTGDNEPLTPHSYQRIIGDVFGETEILDNAVDYVIMLIDLGCDTNGKLRRFFDNPAVLDLRERFIKLESHLGKISASSTLEQPIHDFFMLWGVRLEAAEEVLQKLSKGHLEK
jgi:ppGpp synthetase/RelA/SpoT-type nucleotidyltranferase